MLGRLWLLCADRGDESLSLRILRDPLKQCTDSLPHVMRYQNRINGPLLDLIDIHMQVPRVDYDKLSGNRLGEASAQTRERVERARDKQRAIYNAKFAMQQGYGPGEVRRFCEVDDAGRNLLRSAMQQMQLNARAYHRILKLARTISDLAGSERIETAHIAEAIQYAPRKQF